MAVQSNDLRNMSPTLEALGKALTQTSLPKIAAAGSALLDAASQFGSMPADVTMDYEEMTPEDRSELYDLLFTIGTITRAAHDPKRRTNDVHAAAGAASDELSLGAECRTIAENVREMLVKLSSDPIGDD